MRSTPSSPLGRSSSSFSSVYANLVGRFGRLRFRPGNVYFSFETLRDGTSFPRTGSYSPSVRHRDNACNAMHDGTVGRGRRRDRQRFRRRIFDEAEPCSRSERSRERLSAPARGRGIGSRSFVGNLWSGSRIDRASWRNLKLLPVTPCSQDIKREARKSMAAVKLSVAYYNCDFREIIPARNNSVPLFIVSFLAFRLSYFYDGSRAVKRPSSSASPPAAAPPSTSPLRSAILVPNGIGSSFRVFYALEKIKLRA